MIWTSPRNVLRVAVLLAATLWCAESPCAASSWNSTGSLTTGRSQHAAVRLGSGSVLVCGGWNHVGDMEHLRTLQPFFWHMVVNRQHGR